MGSTHNVVTAACIAVVLCILAQSAHATIWVVDPSGSGNFTSLDAVTQSKVKPGDTLYLRGKFTTMQTLQNINGTKALPITLTSYPGTRAIFDGAGLSLASYQGLIRLNIVYYIVLDNVLVRNSSQAGISLYYANNVVVKNCEVHDTYVRAIGGCGNDVTIHNNTVYNAVMQNYANSSNSGWSQAVSSNSCYSDGRLVTNWVFEYNTVYNSWGEGIDPTQVDGCIVRHNVVYDTYSVLIYMDNVQNCLIEQNYVYTKDSRYHSPYGPAAGIAVGAESWMAYPKPSFNVTIQNNLLVGTRGISNVNNGGNYVYGTKIWYNTVWSANSSTSYQTFYWPTQNTNATISGNVLKNNLFYGTNQYACVLPGQVSAWTISNNVWVGMGSVPTACVDRGSVNTSIAVANTSRIGFASGTPNYIGSSLTDFLLTATSPARAAGVPVPGTPTDYFGFTRSTTKPSVGFVEYGTNASGDGNGSSASAPSSFFMAALSALF